jgi:hypothetical protein
VHAASEYVLEDGLEDDGQPAIRSAALLTDEELSAPVYTGTALLAVISMPRGSSCIAGKPRVTWNKGHEHTDTQGKNALSDPKKQRAQKTKTFLSEETASRATTPGSEARSENSVEESGVQHLTKDQALDCSVTQRENDAECLC